MNCNNGTIITIKKIVNGGYGLARLPSGKTVLVQHALPGETVAVTPVEAHDRFEYAAICTIEEAHPQRIEPPCPYYGRCGGCDLQHAAYPLQCDIKHHILADLLARSGCAALKTAAGQLPPTIAAPAEFRYRQRIRLQITKRGEVGFKRFRSHEIIPITHCLLAPLHLNDCLVRLLEAEEFHHLARTATELEMLNDPADETICLIFRFTRPPRPADVEAARRLSGAVIPVTRIFFDGTHFAIAGPYGRGEASGSNRLQATLPLEPPLTLGWEAGGFCQVNTSQNHTLVRLALDFCAVSGSDRVLDLYCGMGNFALPAARRAASVHGIESQGSAVRSARSNARANGIANASFEKSDVEGACRLLVERRQRFATVICDPPRQGMAGLAPLLGRLTERRLVYISCDPATLCRDLAALTAEGFALETVQPIDMFPQTHHIETVALLEKD